MRNKILIPLLIIGALAAFFSFTYTRGNTQWSEEKRKIVVQAVMKAIDDYHFSPRQLDDTFSARVFKRAVADLDGGKMYFTKQDMAKLKTYQFKIDDEIRDNSVEFFDTLDAIYLRRVADGENFYKEILKTPFNFNLNDSIQLNPDKEEYADGEAGLKERWRESLKLKVLEKVEELKKDQDKKKEIKDSANARMKTDAELEEQAREDTRKGDDRYFKRLHKEKDYTRFMLYVNAIALTEDPHTEYFPPVEKKNFDEMMSGSFYGIGAQLSPANDKVTVQSIITGSPSWKEGELKANDEIKKVAQGDAEPVDITGMDLDDVVNLIRGPNGTIVKLTVKRNDGTTKVIAIKRGIVEREETFAKSAVINGKQGPVGYIYLPEFYADFNHTSGRSCAVDVANEVKKLKDAGVVGIILDLRNNGGGSLGDVVDMAGVFVGKGPVVQVKDSHTAPSVLRAQANDSALYSGPMAIMVNEGSASASEILAAAMQDYKRAVIVGATTYGKGTVQKMVQLDQFTTPMQHLELQSDTTGAAEKSIGALKLTMEKFYRVNGGSTQRKGVTPDITIPDNYDSYDDEDLGERHINSALAWDEIPPAGYKTTNSVGDLDQLKTLSQSRVNANPIFKSIDEYSAYVKKMRENYVVPLNEKKYKEYTAEVEANSKKEDSLLKKVTPLDITNAPADLERVNADSASITANKNWLKNVSKDIYISETLNIIYDMPKSSMKLNRETGMK